MEDYLKEFGISPQEFGIERFIKTKAPADRSVKNHHTAIAGRSTGMGEDRFSNIKLDNLPLTMAYVPFQKIEGTYNKEEALKAGTLFSNLDKPFLGKRP